MSTLYDISVERIDGTSSTLREFSGEVLLIVNVASKCGLTPQYAGLEALYAAKRAAGLQILGFPANNFKEQEPGSNEEISQFCALTYGVSFPMFSKISVSGDDIHPLYRELIALAPPTIEKPDGAFRKKLEERGLRHGAPSDVLWNFEKFLVARDGSIVGRFAPDITPDDPVLHAAVERELARR